MSVATVSSCHPQRRLKARGLCEPCYDKARRVAQPGRELARRKAWQAANPDRYRAILRRSRERYRYGLEPGVYEAMLEAQGGVCAICRGRPSERLHIDHDHEGGRIRALLCADCNRAIGLLHEDPERMRAAAMYVETHR